jgi:TonB family protein
MAKSLSFHAGEIRVLLASDPNAFNGYPGDITVLRSPDSGDTWAPIAKLPAHGLRAGPFSNPDDPQDFFIAAVSAPGGTPGAFGDSFRVNAVKVLETRDGGATWKVIYQNAASGQNPGMGFLHGVAQIAHGSDRSILLATNKGLLRSDDEGNTWMKLGGLQVDGSSSAANAQGAGGNKTEPSGPYHVGGNISAPKVLYSVEAQLTSEARRAHYQGTCVVGFTVDAEGIPQDVHIVRPLEYGLNEAAMEAVRKYRFTPAYKDETTPVPVLLQIAIEFKQY